jgi:hypothetical protein
VPARARRVTALWATRQPRELPDRRGLEHQRPPGRAGLRSRARPRRSSCSSGRRTSSRSTDRERSYCSRSIPADTCTRPGRLRRRRFQSRTRPARDRRSALPFDASA